MSSGTWALRRLWLLWRLRWTVQEIAACDAAGIATPMVEEFRRQARQFRAALVAMEV